MWQTILWHPKGFLQYIGLFTGRTVAPKRITPSMCETDVECSSVFILMVMNKAAGHRDLSRLLFDLRNWVPIVLYTDDNGYRSSIVVSILDYSARKLW